MNNIPQNNDKIFDFNEFDLDQIRTGSFPVEVAKFNEINEINRSLAIPNIQQSSIGWQGRSSEMAHISPESVLYHGHDLNTKYRGFQVPESVSVLSLQCNQEDSLKTFQENHAIMPPKLQHDRKAYPSIVLVEQNEQISSTSGAIKIPPKPFYLTKTHFLCLLSIYEIISTIEKRLNSVLEISYQFVKSECMWEAVYLRGSSFCKFQIHVYKENSRSSIIEGNRLSGDGFSFRKIYEEIKADFSGIGILERDSFSVNQFSGISVPSVEPLKDSEAASAIKPIIDMAKSNLIDSQYEASAILCDLSSQEDMEHVLVEEGCVKVLMDLVCAEGEFQSCNYHAICALANLSSSLACQEHLVSSPFLSALLKLSSDGPYYSAELRRESARVLANICERHSSKVLSVVDSEILQCWLRGVDEIRDERLRTHANRAKLSLRESTATVH